MSSKVISRIFPALLAIAFCVMIAWGAGASMAGSAAELLEQGIYTEQTVGDLDAAIEIYTQIVEDAEANRRHVSQAQFRLGMCFLKNGNDAQAREALERLIRDYPEQEQLVAEARVQLASVQPGLPLGVVPWKSGEFLLYRMSLPTGKAVGHLYLTAVSTVVDGVEAWQLEMRRFVFSSADNYGVNRMLVERDSLRPIQTTFRHGALGNSDVTFGPEGIEVRLGGESHQVESQYQVYDNDQGMHLMRMLPLELGYQAKVHYLPAWTTKIVEVGLKVKKEDTCRVPAGEFECHQVNLDIGQTIWYSKGPEQYPVKMKAEGIVIELAEIRQFEPGATTSFGLPDFGFSGTLQAGWLAHEIPNPERRDSTLVRILDPYAGAITGIEANRCPPRGCPTLKDTADGELKGAMKRFQGFELREGSWSEMNLDGRDAISFVGDFQRNRQPWVQYRFYTFVDDVRLEIIFRTPASLFPELKPAFDEFLEGLRAE